jgi:hypothetical protein
MDLLNQALNSCSTQIAEGGWSINPAIFETNLLNLILLDGLLLYLLSSILSERLQRRRRSDFIAGRSYRLSYKVAYQKLREKSLKIRRLAQDLPTMQGFGNKLGCYARDSILADCVSECDRIYTNGDDLFNKHLSYQPDGAHQAHHAGQESQHRIYIRSEILKERILVETYKEALPNVPSYLDTYRWLTPDHHRSLHDRSLTSLDELITPT